MLLASCSSFGSEMQPDYISGKYLMTWRAPGLHLETPMTVPPSELSESNLLTVPGFLNKCGILGTDMDDDVMDQQKFASGAMVLARALVEKQKEMDIFYDEQEGHILPQIPLYKARYIMTRADFIQSYDHENIFTIDSKAMVRADSVPMMNAFKEICAEEGFDEFLENTLDRISAIESIGRTKEFTFKDLWFEQRNEQRGKYSLITKDSRGRETGSIEFMVTPNPSPEDGKDD